MSLFSSIFNGLNNIKIPSPQELLNNAIRGVGDVANTMKVGATDIFNKITSINPLAEAEKVMNFTNKVTASIGTNFNNILGKGGLAGVAGAFVNSVPNNLFNNTVNTTKDAVKDLGDAIGKPATTALSIGAMSAGIAAVLVGAFVLKRF